MLVCVSLIMAGCRKACITKSLGDLHCIDGFIPVADTRYLKAYHYGYFTAVSVINNVQDYKNKFSNDPDSMPFGFIDFEKYSLVCGPVQTGDGNGFNHQGGLCYNPESGRWMMTVEYTLSGQCKGSGLNDYNFLASIICPKLPADVSIEFRVTNINPL